MTTDTQAREVLALFATYGFRKASMGDIAEAAGVSRQSIYNQHGSKEAVLDWALRAFLEDLTDAAIEALAVEAPDPLQALGTAFQRWAGDHVGMLRNTAHGGALMESAIETAVQSDRDYEAEYSAALIAFLQADGLAPNETRAEDISFTLHAASKGLLIKSKSSEDYAAAMARVLSVVLGA